MRALTALFVLAALIGCASTPKGPTAGPDPATLATEELAIAEQGITDFKVRWEGKLQSPEPATLERASYELVVDGKVVKSGEKTFGLAITPGEAAPVSLEHAGRYVADAEELQKLDARAGSLLVALRGKLFVKRGDVTDEVDFARSREIRLPRLPIVGIREVEGARYSAESVTLTFHLTITNPNPFNILVDKVEYVADVGGKKMAEGEVATSNTVNASETDSYEFQVPLDPATYGPEVKKLIASKSVPWKVNGTLKGDLFTRTLQADGVVTLHVSR